MAKPGTVGAGCGVVLAGSLAQRPGFGGHTWVFLQYLLGFRALGCEVTFLDRLDRSTSFDEHGHPCSPARSANFRYTASVMDGFGLTDDFAVASDEGGGWLGLCRSAVLQRVKRASVLINVMGFLEDPEVLAAANRRVFLDIDPGFGQMWKQLGLADVFAGHDVFV
ncbi:MAG: hypothetical protein ACRDIA_08710, partial [Actinomycetota bacterium]